MEEIEVTSNKKQFFEIFIPKDCDLNTVNRVTVRGREFVPVVRCKDCKWWINGMCYSDNFILRFEEVKPDWFCADGERKDG